MSTRLYIGKSTNPDVGLAIGEASRLALCRASEPVLALVLSAGGNDPSRLAAALSQELGSIPWIGCSSAGVIVGSELIHHGVALGIVSSGEAYVGTGIAGPVSRNPAGAGAAAVARALDQLPPLSPQRSRAILIFVDAVGGQGAEAVRGAVREGGTAAAWAGGGAGGDNLGGTRTSLLARGSAYYDHVVVAALDLPGPIGVGMRHGWRPYGPPLMVTRSEGAIAHELEYEPAFEMYRRIAVNRGDDVSAESFAAFAMSHPLGIPQADGEHVIRDPLNVEQDGGLRCISEVPDGALVRLMQGNPRALLVAAQEAAVAARKRAGGILGGALVFDCVSRSLMLGDEIGEELRGFQTAIGMQVPLMGCLTFGEIGALGAGVPQFHNKAAVVLALPGETSP
jgi:hypothetical protein